MTAASSSPPTSGRGDDAAAHRRPECVERWPECESGAYDPSCCRFPKSCSCNVRPEESAAQTYDPPRSWDDSRVCQNCVRTEGSYRNTLAYVILNTRTGKYHASAGYGMTNCGVDATGDEFLWPI